MSLLYLGKNLGSSYNSTKYVKMINEFVETHSKRSKVFLSLGQLLYLSCMQQVDGVLGNSSSGLIEAPSFFIGTINIGDRQKGRIKSRSIIDCNPDRISISKAIDHLYSKKFQRILPTVQNPYGKGGASEKIVKILENFETSDLLKKEFIDIKIA